MRRLKINWLLTSVLFLGCFYKQWIKISVYCSASPAVSLLGKSQFNISV